MRTIRPWRSRKIRPNPEGPATVATTRPKSHDAVLFHNDCNVATEIRGTSPYNTNTECSALQKGIACNKACPVPKGSICSTQFTDKCFNCCLTLRSWRP